MTGKLLIIEDEEHVRENLAEILELNGFKPLNAIDGMDGLELAISHQPDLILSDVMMPGMDGFELCQRLKRHNNTKDIPVIFLTARNDTDSILQGFEMGAVDYITKPFKIKEVLARVKTHLQLRYTERQLIEANATKDKFFSIIAHDLRNPFVNLIELSGVLKAEYGRMPENMIQKYHSAIHKASSEGLNLLKNLLEWSRSQTGKIKYEPRPLILSSIIKETFRLLNTDAEKKNIKLQHDANEYRLLADYNMTRTVMRNLVSNAIKFTEQGGWVKVSSRLKKQEVQIAIQDNGIGISPENLDKLFHPLNHHSTRGTGEEKGTGLGLILCKEFIEHNKGRITVESKLRKGSTFYVYLPLAEEPA